MYSSLDVFDDPIFASSLQPLALQLHSAASKRVFSQESSWSHYEVDQITSNENHLAQLVFLNCRQFKVEFGLEYT